MSMIKTDQIDAKIISTLIKDARTTLTDLAKICKISLPAVKKRIEQLKKKGAAGQNQQQKSGWHPFPIKQTGGCQPE